MYRCGWEYPLHPGCHGWVQRMEVFCLCCRGCLMTVGTGRAGAKREGMDKRGWDYPLHLGVTGGCSFRGCQDWKPSRKVYLESRLRTWCQGIRAGKSRLVCKEWRAQSAMQAAQVLCGLSFPIHERTQDTADTDHLSDALPSCHLTAPLKCKLQRLARERTAV